MNTSYEDIFSIFKSKIVQDKEFFIYNGLDEFETEDIIKERCLGYLKSAISQLILNCTPQINFNDYDDTLEQFNIELTKTEKELLAELMREHYFAEDMAKLKVMMIYFNSREIQTFSPSGERKSFTDMFKEIQNNNNLLIKRYASRDRITGKLKTLSYDSL